MTKDAITFNDIAVVTDGGSHSMNLDPFKDSTWRHKLSEKSDGDQTTVTLSSGKTITVETKFLRFLRALAEELASKEPINH